jgi:hypothetical protein
VHTEVTCTYTAHHNNKNNNNNNNKHRRGSRATGSGIFRRPVTMNGRRLALVCAVLLASFDRRSEAFCGLRTDDGGGDGDFVKCLKAKAIATLDRVALADTVPLAGSVALVKDVTDPQAHRRQRSDDDDKGPTTEQELRSEPDATLDRMLYDRAVRFFSGRALRIGLPEFTPDQLRTALEEGNYNNAVN